MDKTLEESLEREVNQLEARLWRPYMKHHDNSDDAKREITLAFFELENSMYKLVYAEYLLTEYKERLRVAYSPPRDELRARLLGEHLTKIKDMVSSRVALYEASKTSLKLRFSV